MVGLNVWLDVAGGGGRLVDGSELLQEFLGREIDEWMTVCVRFPSRWWNGH